MHYNVIIYVLFIDFLAIMSPGPDFFMVLRNALTNSLQAGIYTTFGIALGSGIMFSIGLFGLGILIMQSKFLFTIIKLIGALYLSYLALKALLLRVKIQEPQLVYAKPLLVNPWQYFKLGLFCNLTNPKAFMFIVSLSTYVVAHPNNYLDKLTIVVGSTVATLVWFMIVSCIFGTFKVRKVFYQKQRLINSIFGLVLLYMASKIILL